MEEHPFHNKKDHAVHIGGKVIHPGETRMVDASLLHSAHEGEDKATEAKQQDPLLDILDGDVGQVSDALAGLSSDELDALESAEEKGNTRKGVLKAIAEARLTLASDEGGDTEADNPDEDGDGSGADVPALKVVQESGES